MARETRRHRPELTKEADVMADPNRESGMKKLVLQKSADDSGTLWAHQGDDDLPDPIGLKRDMAEGRPRKEYHRGILKQVWLSPAEAKRLRRLQMRHGLSFAAWVRRALDLDEKERPSEAKDYVRKIIPEQVAVVAERELITVAETLSAIANRQTDWQAKKNLRGDAGVIMDVAAYFTEIRKEYERLQAHDPR